MLNYGLHAYFACYFTYLPYKEKMQRKYLIHTQYFTFKSLKITF